MRATLGTVGDNLPLIMRATLHSLATMTSSATVLVLEWRRSSTKLIITTTPSNTSKQFLKYFNLNT